MSTMVLAHTPAARPTLRITRRGRLVLGVLAVAPIVALSAAGVLSSAPATATGDSATSSFAYVTVEPGESLWSVAERIAPQSDPREVIADIERLNSLESSAVAAGQSLAIPAEYGR